MSRSREWLIATPDERATFLRWLAHQDLARFPLGLDVVVKVHEERHSAAQQRLLRAILREIAAQVVWHGEKLDPETWKELLTAAKQGERIIPGIYGGLVRVGSSTKHKSVAWLSELIEFAYAFGAEQGVKFRTPRGMSA